MKRLLKNISLIAVGILTLLGATTGMLYANEDSSVSQIKIAIIDSGADSYVDYARSFTSYPAHKDPMNHGTEIAKLIRRNNPSAHISMLQVFEMIGNEGRPSRDAILQAINWCMANGINIVNMSLVIKYDKEIDEIMTRAATSHGIVFVAAAGNRTIASHFAADKDGYICKVAKTVKPAFPASNPDAIAVGGLDQNGEIAAYSDKGCDIYASGKVLGQEGSSFATARITGRIAEILTKQPHATKKDILSLLKKE